MIGADDVRSLNLVFAAILQITDKTKSRQHTRLKFKCTGGILNSNKYFAVFNKVTLKYDTVSGPMTLS